MGQKKGDIIFKFIFIPRILLGGIFIYSGIYKIVFPKEFIQVIKNYGIIPSMLVKPFSLFLPCIELILGILLITGILARYAALASSMLIIIFIILTILNAFRGAINHCGCFPESSILNSYNPFVLVIRNFIFLVLAITTVFPQKALKSRPLFSIKGYIYEFTFLFLIAFAFSILLVLIGTRRYENKYVSEVMNERNLIAENIGNLKDKKLPEFELKGNNGRLFYSTQLKGNYSVLLILNSLECKPCIDEAIFVENLNRKFGTEINFYAIVGRIGQAAIYDIKKRYSLGYQFFQDLNNEFFNKFTSYNAVKILISPTGEIINIDPPTYRVKSLQIDYEKTILRCLENKGGDKIGCLISSTYGSRISNIKGGHK